MPFITRLPALLLFVLSTCGLCLAQTEFRQAAVGDGSTEERDLVLGAAQTADAAQRVTLLDGFVSQNPDSAYRPYALYNILISGKDAGRHEKTLEAGLQLLEWAPNDLEVRHRINEAYVGLERWDELAPSIDLSKPVAKVQATQDGFPGEYASGVLDWLAWASNVAYLGEADPAKKIAWLERIRIEYPESEYAQDMYPRYIQSYQQAGDRASSLAWMQKSIEAGADDESYRYTLAEEDLGRQDFDAALEHAERALEILETKQSPAGMSAEQWEQYKTKMTAYANFVTGRAWVGRDSKDAYRTGRTYLLETVDVLKAEGGERYNLLAYYLGICYAQLDVKGDSVQQALQWMTEAANSPGPVQEQARQALAKLQAAI
ncbi:MAG: hypothetical protein O3A53_02140 [Acidobacteria bacterium]|nr:hypothetical protein [Acidobacteriota bacterium]MDA1233581.1 hypothetical protein [Acidobacteriota bacterium]